MTPITGDLTQIYLSEFGSTAAAKIIGCTTGDTFTDTTEMVEVTTLVSDFVSMKPTYKSATLSTDCIILFTEGGDAQYATTQLLEWSKAKTKLTFLFIFSDGTTDVDITGSCYITSLSINAPAQDFANVTISLQCTGEWSIT